MNGRSGQLRALGDFESRDRKSDWGSVEWRRAAGRSRLRSARVVTGARRSASQKELPCEDDHLDPTKKGPVEEGRVHAL